MNAYQASAQGRRDLPASRMAWFIHVLTNVKRADSRDVVAASEQVACELARTSGTM